MIRLWYLKYAHAVTAVVTAVVEALSLVKAQVNFLKIEGQISKPVSQLQEERLDYQ